MLTDALTMARQQIGEVSVRGTPPGAEVFVNGRTVGRLPLSSPIKLAPSNTELAVRAPGFSERREVVRVTGGQRYELTFNLEPTTKTPEATKPAAPAVTVAVDPTPVSPVAVAPISAAPGPMATAEQPASPASDASAGSGLRTTAWITGGAAVAAGGAGLALHLMARSSESYDDWAWKRRWRASSATPPEQRSPLRPASFSCSLALPPPQATSTPALPALRH